MVNRGHSLTLRALIPCGLRFCGNFTGILIVSGSLSLLVCFSSAGKEVKNGEAVQSHIDAEKRQELIALVSTGKCNARKIKHANLLLAVDERENVPLTDREAARRFYCRANTKRFPRHFRRNAQKNGAIFLINPGRPPRSPRKTPGSSSRRWSRTSGKRSKLSDSPSKIGMPRFLRGKSVGSSFHDVLPLFGNDVGSRINTPSFSPICFAMCLTNLSRISSSFQSL